MKSAKNDIKNDGSLKRFTIVFCGQKSIQILYFVIELFDKALTVLNETTHQLYLLQHHTKLQWKKSNSLLTYIHHQFLFQTNEPNYYFDNFYF